MSEAELGKTQLKQIEQYRDRWSSLGVQTGLIGCSDQLTVEQLREFEIFKECDDKLLEKIRQDVSVATWKEDAVLFEEGTYIDLAFLVVEGEVEVYLEGVAEDGTGARPIFDSTRTVVTLPSTSLPSTSMPDASMTSDPARTTMMKFGEPAPAGTITFLATMDFDLPRGAATRLGPGEFFGEIGALSGWPNRLRRAPPRSADWSRSARRH